MWGVTISEVSFGMRYDRVLRLEPERFSSIGSIRHEPRLLENEQANSL